MKALHSFWIALYYTLSVTAYACYLRCFLIFCFAHLLVILFLCEPKTCCLFVILWSGIVVSYCLFTIILCINRSPVIELSFPVFFPVVCDRVVNFFLNYCSSSVCCAVIFDDYLSFISFSLLAVPSVTPSGASIFWFYSASCVNSFGNILITSSVHDVAISSSYTGVWIGVVILNNLL
jgi:hypothetical protein